jgi:electron transport complex protein RnfG
LVNELTKGAIEKASIDGQNKAIAAILPQFDHLGKSYKLLPDGETDSIEFFPACDKDSQLVATAIKTYTKKGFSGLFTVMVGIDTEGTITGFKVLQHQETPGLGSKMQLWFSNKEKPGQDIIGKNPTTVNFTVKKDGGAIDAITAATISSRAFLESIRRAHSTWKGERDAMSGATTKVDNEHQLTEEATPEAKEEGGNL